MKEYSIYIYKSVYSVLQGLLFIGEESQKNTISIKAISRTLAASGNYGDKRLSAQLGFVCISDDQLLLIYQHSVKKQITKTFKNV